MARGDPHELARDARPAIRVAHVVEVAKVEYQIEGAVLEGERAFEVGAGDREGRTPLRLVSPEPAQTFHVEISAHELDAGSLAELLGETAKSTGEIEDALRWPGSPQEGPNQPLLAEVDEGLRSPVALSEVGAAIHSRPVYMESGEAQKVSRVDDRCKEWIAGLPEMR